MFYNSLEHFLTKIRHGEVPLGCVVTFTDPAVTEIAAESGFDFCWIDGEHGVLDRQTAMLHMMALKGTGCAPLYRVPACDHTEIKKIIDFAPAGIIVPMVLSAADATCAAAACRYPPTGNRGCGYRRGNRYGAIPTAEYLEQARREPLVILQIEHIDAVRSLDAILAVPGVDGCLIGPYDLSTTLGKSGAFDDPEVNAVFDEVCAKVRASGKILGVYAEGNYDRWLRRGVQFIGCINDTSAMAMGFRFMREKIAKARAAAPGLSSASAASQHPKSGKKLRGARRTA